MTAEVKDSMILEFLQKLLSRLLSGDASQSGTQPPSEAGFQEPHDFTPDIHEPEKLTDTQENRTSTTSRRAFDMSAEAQLALFLDKYLYERFPDIHRYSSIKRISDKREQLNGTDVRFIMKDGRVFNVDEKAQLYYLNKNLPTFAFEIQFLRRGIPTTGWLCNDRLETDYYLLIWPFADRDTSSGISWRNFTKADCLMISKQDVLSFLAENGLTKDRLLADANAIRKEHRTGKIRIEGLSGIYYFASYPQYYAEAPINIVISKSYLRHIATRHYIVTPEKVEHN